MIKILQYYILLASILILNLIFCLYSYASDQDFKWSVPINLDELNSVDDDFAPSWNPYENTLYFNSAITGYSLFYKALRLDSINFNQPELLEDEINPTHNNQSYITFITSDIAYLSTFRVFGKRSYLNIFQSRKKKKNWLAPIALDSLTIENFSAQATVSPDGSFMIFSTDKNSDFGDTDLWMAFRQDNGTWGNFICIPKLKSPGNEITPYLASNDTLYYASDGQEGPGGYDLFFSIRFGGVWQRPYPLSELNTEFDESDFIILPNNQAIFSSNMPGGKGKLDLYLTYPKKNIDSNKVVYDIELDLAAQVSSLIAEGTFEYQVFPIINYFIFNKDEVAADGLNVYQNINEKNILPSLDTVYKYSLSIIANRMRNYPEAKLYFYIKAGSEIQQNEIQDFTGSIHSLIEGIFVNKSKIQRERIIIKQIEMQEFTGESSLIFIDSDEEKIFEPLQLGYYKDNQIKPPALEISLDGRPRNTIQSYECFFTSDGNNPITINKGNFLPSKFTFSLKPYSETLLSSDSLIIHAVVKNPSSENIHQKLVLNISHILKKENKFITIAGKKYEEFLIHIIPDYLSDNSLMGLINQINLSAVASKEIIIQYFDDGSNSFAYNLVFINKLKNLLSDKLIIKPEKISDFKKMQVDKKFAPYFIRLLVMV